MMSRNRTLRNMPEWAQQFMNEMLKPPRFMTEGKENGRVMDPYGWNGGATRSPNGSSNRSSTHPSSAGDAGRPSRSTSDKDEIARPRRSSKPAADGDAITDLDDFDPYEDDDEVTTAKATQTKRPRKANGTSKRGTRASSHAGSDDANDGRMQPEPVRKWRAALLNADIPEPVLYAYGFDIVDVIRHQNIVRIVTEDGNFALKTTHASASRVKFLQKAIEHARSHGFEKVTPIVPTVGDKYYVLHDSGVYYASEWITGTPVNFASSVHVGAVAKSLAEWHETTRGFNPQGFRPEPEFAISQMLARRTSDLRRLLAQAENQSSQDEFDKTFISLGAGLQKDASKSVRLVESDEVRDFLKQDRENPGICHLDVIPGNFIFDGERQAHLLDLDLATYAPRALDISHLLRRGLEHSRWNTDIAYVTFLHFNEIRSISRPEYTLIQALLTFPYRAWRLAHTRYGVLADDAQIEEIKMAANEETRRHAFLESYARQIP